MDFDVPGDIEELRLRVRNLVDQMILPMEDRPEVWGHGETITEEALADLRNAVRSAG